MASTHQKIVTHIEEQPKTEDLEPDFHQLSVKMIIDGCEQEAKKPREEEVGYCFELFRRGIEEQDNQAWQALQIQYGRLIHSWIHARMPKTLSNEEREDLIQDTWTNFYGSLTKHSIPLSNNFRHVGALLSYLNKCVLTATIDYQRRLAKHRRLQQRLEMETEKWYSAPDASVLEQIAEQKRIRAIQEWIAKNVTDPKEKLVLSCSFETGLKPKEIYDRYPDMFKNVQTVYRVKERILKRARRSFKMAVF